MTRGFDGSRVFRTGVKSKVAVVLEEERERERAEKGYRFVWFNCDGSVDQEEGGCGVFGTVYQLVGSVFEDWDEWDGYRAGFNGNGSC